MKSFFNIQNLKLYSSDGTILAETPSLSILKNDKVGLIGKNGSGKTTLLKLIAQKLNQKFVYINNSDQDLSVVEYLNSIHDEWWNIIAIYKEIFQKDLNIDAMIKDLSGGERSKLIVASSIFISANIVLLDEPTNHLDLNSINQLIKYIEQSDKSFIIASHDIYFVNNVCKDIWAIENKEIEKFSGSYSEYLENKKKREEKLIQLYKLELGKIELLKKAAMERETQSKLTHIHVHRNPYVKKKAGRKARVALVLKRKINKRIDEKLEKLKIPKSKNIYMQVEPKDNNLNLLIRIKDQKISFGDKLILKDLNLSIYSSDRILVSGDNGSGKTSLLKKLIEVAKNDLDIVYLSQNLEIIDNSKTVFENISEFNKENLGYEDIRKFLGNFLFITEEDIAQKAQNLSNGQKTRLVLAMISVRNCDLLILDEPTNNLDVQTIEFIIDSLKRYSGGLIVVSHNQNFVQSIGINREISINEGKVEEKF